MTAGTMTRAQLEVYLSNEGYAKAQGRIGIDVYRKAAKRSKFELTVCEARRLIVVYDLMKGRRQVGAWELL